MSEGLPERLREFYINFFFFVFVFVLTGHYVTETVTYSLYVVMSKISMYF